jgi:c-di-GMP-related signal transduction protein
MQEVNYLIGRQPILDRNEEIVAYELLFRSAGSRNMERPDPSPEAKWLEEIGLSQEDVLQAQVKAYGWRDGML